MDAFFAAQPDVTAMVCGQDWLSEILVTYFDERGIDVPGDIELAVLDDNLTPTHRVLPRCLSAVQDGRAVGEEACELLLRRIREADAPLRQTLVPARFVGYGIRKAGSRLMTRPRGKEAN
jgi:DNA-binding LacI/PurR family transcriptional regulator